MSAITKLADRFTETDIDHEIVIMRLDTGEFFSLAGTAPTLWRLIDGTRDEAALVVAAANEYSADRSVIAADVHEFLQQLRGLGLLAVR